MNKISFYPADRKISIQNRNAVRQLICEIFKKEKTGLDMVSCIFCSDEYLLEINRRYLNHPNYTDVITFSLADSNAPVLAEIYLSIDRIKENAKEYEEKYQTELLRVIIHGALHLCGYNDKSITQKKEMRLRENFYLQLYTKGFT